MCEWNFRHQNFHTRDTQRDRDRDRETETHTHTHLLVAGWRQLEVLGVRDQKKKKKKMWVLSCDLKEDKVGACHTEKGTLFQTEGPTKENGSRLTWPTLRKRFGHVDLWSVRKRAGFLWAPRGMRTPNPTCMTIWTMHCAGSGMWKHVR